MSSVKSWMVGVVAGAATVGSFGAFAQVPTLVVGKHSQIVQLPTTVPSGVVYQATGTQSSTLSAYTDGFLFCGNIGSEPELLVTLAPGHEDQSSLLNPAHSWALPSALALNFAYNGGRFVVTPGATLACQSLGKQGEVVSGLTDGIFDNGYDSKAETNYGHLVNWNPQVGFDWSQPDWTQVPKDACISTANQPAKVVEDEACAAATGVRPGGSSSVRAATIWTASDAISFTYLFRVDLRYGAQPANAVAEFQLPQGGADAGLTGAPTGLSFMLVEGYDENFLSSTGQYCLLGSEDLPTTLNSSVCSGANPVSLNGLLRYSNAISPPPLGTGSSTFYVAVTRQRLGGGSHADLSTPVVAVSVLVDPALTAEGGNKFTGDDVVFGFMPSSNGFPWMSGQ